MPAFTPVVPAVAGLQVPVRLGAGVSRVAARSARWRPVARGWYVRADAPDVVEQRVLEQSTRLEGAGAATGWAALRARRGGYFDGLERDGRTRRRVPLVAGTSRVRDDEHVWVVREWLAEEEVTVHQGVRCVSPERAVAHEVCRSDDPREAVVVVDMACAAELTSLRRLRHWLDDHPGWRNRDRLVLALALADEHSHSPAETRMRLVWVLDAGRPRPLCNRQVFDAVSGRLIGVPDLLDPVAGVYGEYDGADHRTRGRHRRDVRRGDLFRRTGLEEVTAVGGDLDSRPMLVDRIEAAYRRSGAGPRSWRMGAAVHPVTGRPCPALDDRLDARDRARRRAVRAAPIDPVSTP